MQPTSNHSWNAGDRPALRVTPAGIQLLAYLDYVTPHTFVSLQPTDTVGPTTPPEKYDDERQPLPEAWNPRITPWQDIPPDDDFDLTDDDDDMLSESNYGEHSPEED
jgi:hypothetical protein